MLTHTAHKEGNFLSHFMFKGLLLFSLCLSTPRTEKVPDITSAPLNQNAIFSTLDNIKLVVTCDPEELITECRANENEATAAIWNDGNISMLEACSFDTCSGSLVVMSDYNFANYNLVCGSHGNITVTYTISDDCGNLVEKSASFSTTDNTPPEVACEVIDMQAECGANSNQTLADLWNADNIAVLEACSTDNCSPDAIVVSSDYDFDNFVISCGNNGSITVSYLVTDDCGNQVEQRGTFSTTDYTPPVVTCQASDAQIECAASSSQTLADQWNEDNITALEACSSDHCSPSVDVSSDYDFTNFVTNCGTNGAITVTYTVTDDCGNQFEQRGTFSTTDQTPPVVTCEVTDLEVECSVSTNQILADQWNADNITLLEACSSDNCSPNAVVVSSDYDFTNYVVNCGTNGSITVTYTIRDDCGNIILQNGTFSTTDLTPPTVKCDPDDSTSECESSDYEGIVSAWNTANIAKLQGCSSDICFDNGIVVTSDYNFSNVAADGSITVTYQITDDCGNYIEKIATFSTLECPPCPETEAGTDNSLDFCFSTTEILIDMESLLGIHDDGTFIESTSSGVSLTNPNSVDFAGVAAGIYTFVFTTAVPDTCEVDEALITITVNSLPTLSDASICDNGSALMEGSGIPASTTPYVSSNPAVAMVATDGSAVVTAVSPGTAMITFTDINGCRATAKVTIDSVPSFTIANPTLCHDGTSMYDLTTLEPAGFTGGVWADNTGVAMMSTMILPVDGDNYSYTFQGANGCALTAEIILDVNAIPNPGSGGTAITCAGDVNVETVFSTTRDPGGTFSFGSWPGTEPVLDANNIATLIAGNYTVNYTVTNSDGCTATIGYALIVNALPTLSDATICENDFALLVGSGIAASMTPYTSSDTTIATVDNSGVVTAVTPGTTTIMYTDENGCQTTATVTVEICCPDLSAPPTLEIIDSSCEVYGGEVSGGLITYGLCPEGSTIMYSTDGVTYTDNPVPYDQSNSLNVFVRCECMGETGQPNNMTTNPGVCPDPYFGVTNNFDVTDPCVCNGDQGDNNEAGDGTFNETVTITGPAGLIVRVATETNGAIQPNTQMTESPAGSGSYILNFDHQDRVGFHITLFEWSDDGGATWNTATDGSFVVVMISNVCAYPVLSSTLDPSTCNINGGFELTTLLSLNTTIANPSPIYTSSMPAGLSFTIDGVVSNILNPANLAIGTHTLVATYSYENGPGNGGTIDNPAIGLDNSNCPIVYTQTFELLDCEPIPTMGEWGLIILLLLLLILGVATIKSRQVQQIRL